VEIVLQVLSIGHRRLPIYTNSTTFAREPVGLAQKLNINVMG
jgi:hypothetical protein